MQSTSSARIRENIICENELKTEVFSREIKIKTASVFKRILCSHLFWNTVVALATTTVTIVALSVPPLSIPVLAIGMIASLALGISSIANANRKKLFYEISLAYNYIKNKFNKKNWPSYNKITDQIYLGRLPLKNRNDHEIMLKQKHIGAVLSIVERFENHTLGILSDPVTPKDWKKLGVEHKQIEARDFRPLYVDDIKNGVEFIEDEARKGKKVYIHCKAGRSRSASVVAAYLVKNKNYSSLEDAITAIKKKRPIVSISPIKMDSIQAYLKDCGKIS